MAIKPKPAKTAETRSIRAELAEVMGIDLGKATIADRMRLDRAATLRLFVANTLAIQEAGLEVDVKALAEASKMLDALLPPPPPPEPAGAQDLSRLTDDELHTLEHLQAKAAGEEVGPVVTFRLEFVGAEPALMTSTDTETAHLRSRVADLEAQLASRQAAAAVTLLPPEQPPPKPEPKTGFVGRIVDNVDAAANARAQAHRAQLLDMSATSAPPGGWSLSAVPWGSHK
jgi:hypothetical protein